MTMEADPNAPSQDAIPEAMDIDNASSSHCEADFIQICKEKLCLDDQYMLAALRLYREMSFKHEQIGPFTAQDFERFRKAAVIHMAKKYDKRELPAFTLSQILVATEVGVLEFIKELPQFLVRCGPILNRIYGPEWEKELEAREERENFIHLMRIFKCYKRSFTGAFDTPGDDNTRMKFGWILYVSLRPILGRFPDLVTSTHALLAVMALMVVHMPTSLRKFDSSVFPKTDEVGMQIVASLAHREQAAEEDVMSMVSKAQTLMATIFPNIPRRKASSNIDRLQGFSAESEGLVYFEGLLDDETVASNLQTLEAYYLELHKRQGYVDERVFICADERGETFSELASQGKLLSQVMDVDFSPACGPPLVKPPESTIMPPPTPVSLTMTTVKWLRQVISPLPAEPSEPLLEFLQASEPDVTDEVRHRVRLLLERLLPTHLHGANVGVDNAWAEQRRQETLKLYYRVLLAICNVESNRLHTKKLTQLLTNDKFHRCMIACSAELVLAAHKTVILTFPAVVEPCGITAFDLCKVIETFVRYEETLPRELKRHLNTIEERITESIAWMKQSSLYNVLIIAKPQLAQEILRYGYLAGPMPSLEPVSGGDPNSPPRQQTAGFVSPQRPSAFSVVNNKRSYSQLHSSFASPQRPNPSGHGETCAENTINVFFSKVMKLSMIRIKVLCDRTKQSQVITENAYKLVQTVLQKYTYIFFGRHLDQIVLCAVYGVSKVLSANPTSFRELIFEYRKQPQCKSHVFRTVPMDPRRAGKSGETGDIIKFYNDYFVPRIKPLLTGLQHVVQESKPAPAPAQAPPASNVSIAPATAPAPESDGAVPIEEDPVGTAPAPASPRATIPSSAFPNVPDMSPKKVSHRHNVYVSPLRSTKVENIMSPHSRSLYACIGESTHAYQSPSKDLTAINNRLNNRRFGRLDFDEASLVSDSFVGGDFCPPIPSSNVASGGGASGQTSMTRMGNSNGNGNQSELKPSIPQSPPPKRPKLDR